MNRIFVFNASGLKYELIPHTEGDDLHNTELIIKEHKNSMTPYRIQKFLLESLDMVQKFKEEMHSNQYNIDTHNLFMFCSEPKLHNKNYVKTKYERVKKSEDGKILKISRGRYLEIPLHYLKGARNLHLAFFPTSSFKIYKDPKMTYIEAQTLVKMFVHRYKDHPEYENDINLLLGNPCIEIKFKIFEEEL